MDIWEEVELLSKKWFLVHPFKRFGNKVFGQKMVSGSACEPFFLKDVIWQV
jgi:hypothetical protein